MEKTQIGAAVDRQLWQSVRIKAIEDGITAGDIVEMALRQYMRVDDPKPAPKKRQQVTIGSDPLEVENFILSHEDKSAREMADLLNQAGYVTAKGGAFNMNVAGKIRTKLKREGKR